LAPPPHGLVAESELVGDLAQRGALGPARPDPFPRAPPQLVGEPLAAASLVPGQLSQQIPSLVVAHGRPARRPRPHPPVTTGDGETLRYSATRLPSSWLRPQRSTP